MTLRPCGVVVSVTMSTGVTLDEEHALMASVRVRADKYLFIILPIKKRYQRWQTASEKTAGHIERYVAEKAGISQRIFQKPGSANRELRPRSPIVHPELSPARAPTIYASKRATIEPRGRAASARDRNFSRMREMSYAGLASRW
jgi:hypothetical protein